jgi:hypothetical protein
MTPEQQAMLDVWSAELDIAGRSLAGLLSKDPRPLLAAVEIQRLRDDVARYEGLLALLARGDFG